MVASERLQVILEARDEMTAEIRQATKSIKELEAEQRSYAKAAEEGNREAAESYERVRREIIDQKAAQELLRAEQRLVAREARQAATEQARAAMKARQAAREQVQQTQKVAHSIGRLGDKIGLQGREWDKVAAKAVQYKTKWVAALEKVGLKAKETNRDINADNFGRRWSAAFGEADRSMDRTRRSGGVMAAGWGKVAGAAAVVTGAVMATSSAFNVLSGSIEEARGARKAAAQTAAVMRSMGRTEAPAAVDRMVNRLEKMSGIDGDNLREMTNIMFTFGNVTGKTFTTANELALDLSVAFGKDLQSSAVMVGKALNDPVKGLTALSRIGVSFTAQQQDQVKAMVAAGDAAGAQALIMKELGRQVGGSAKAQADGVAKTQVAWGNLKEAVGEVIMSISSGMGGDLPAAINRMTAIIVENKYIIVSVIQGVASAIFKLISMWLKWQSILLWGLGYLAGAAATTLQILAKTGLVSQNTADAATSLADGLGAASEQANNASTWFDDLSTKAKNASERSLALDRALKKIDGRKARATVEVTLTSAWDAVDAAVDGALAAGGPVLAGNTYLVGEIGPELFVSSTGATSVVGADGPEIRDFHTSGTIIPNVAVSAYVAASREPAMAAAPSGGVQIGELHVHDRFDARREFEAMMARQRRIAAERS